MTHLQDGKIPIPLTSTVSSLRAEMRLTDGYDLDTFKDFTKFMRELIDQTLFMGHPYHRQSKENIRKVKDKACEAFSFLDDRYEDAWPVDYYIRRHLNDTRCNRDRSTGSHQHKSNTAGDSTVSPMSKDDRQRVCSMATSQATHKARKIIPYKVHPPQISCTRAPSGINFRDYLHSLHVELGAMHKHFLCAGIDNRQKVEEIVQWEEGARITLLRTDMGLTAYQYRMLVVEVKKRLSEVIIIDD